MAWELIINGETFFPGRLLANGLRESPRADLISLRVNYNAPRELQFAVAAANEVPLNAEVMLVEKASDDTPIDHGTVRFRGRTMTIGLDSEMARRNVITAKDRSEDSDAVQVLQWKWALGSGALWTMFYARSTAPLAELLTEIGKAAAEELTARKVCNADAATGEGVFSGYHGGDVRSMQLAASGFRGLLDRVTGAVAAVKWLWVPDVSPENDFGTFRIVRLFDGAPVSVDVGNAVVENLPITRSIEGRFSRVHIEPIVYGSAGNGSSQLVPAWNLGLEASWDASKLGPGSAYNAVFRCYSYASIAQLHNILFDSGVQTFQMISDTPAGSDVIPVPIQVERIDQENKLIWFRNPVLRYYAKRHVPINMWMAAGASRTSPVYISYSYYDQHIATAVEVGPDGTAYTLYGLDRTMQVQVDSVQDVTVQKAQEILDTVKDELISGTIPLAGNVPAELWDLGVLLNVSAVGRSIGLENMRAIVNGFTHEFSNGGRTSIEISTDRSAYLAQGVSPV